VRALSRGITRQAWPRAVRVMASVQLGKTLDDATTRSVVSFLESLTGEVPANYAPPGRRPEL
jgi:cytochrome c peroxidase